MNAGLSKTFLVSLFISMICGAVQAEDGTSSAPVGTYNFRGGYLHAHHHMPDIGHHGAMQGRAHRGIFWRVVSASGTARTLPCALLRPDARIVRLDGKPVRHAPVRMIYGSNPCGGA